MKNKLYFYEKNSIEILYGTSNHSFPVHSHESFCVGIVLDGLVEFEINNQKKLLGKSMMFIIPSNNSVKITCTSKYNYITVCIKNNLRESFKNLDFNSYYIQLENNYIFTSLCKKFKTDNNSNDFVSFIHKLISPVINKNKITKNTDKEDIITNICEYINEHAEEKFDLEKLSNEFYISKYHLIRIFKNKMGITPKHYHMQSKLRLLKAKIINDKSEVSVAMDLNMSDVSHMCKIFKKYMGISIHNYKTNYICK